jgi:hypothetical protein
MMQAKELDMLIIHVEMELNLHKTLCHFLVAQLQLEPNLDNRMGLILKRPRWAPIMIKV